MTGPVFGAAVAGVLVIAYGMLGLGAAAALWWAAITSLATLWWPASVTVFDQNQHAFFLLSGLLLAWQSGRRASVRLAALAGLTGGVLLIYQEIYVLLLPSLGLAVFTSPRRDDTRAIVLARPLRRPSRVAAVHCLRRWVQRRTARVRGVQLLALRLPGGAKPV
jgi:hypothetical protein